MVCSDPLPITIAFPQHIFSGKEAAFVKLPPLVYSTYIGFMPSKLGQSDRPFSGHDWWNKTVTVSYSVFDPIPGQMHVLHDISPPK